MIDFALQKIIKLILFSAAWDSAGAVTEAHTDLKVVDLAVVEAMGSEVAVAASSTWEAVASVAVETASKEVAGASREVIVEDQTLLLKCFPQGVKQHV